MLWPPGALAPHRFPSLTTVCSASGPDPGRSSDSEVLAVEQLVFADPVGSRDAVRQRARTVRVGCVGLGRTTGRAPRWRLLVRRAYGFHSATVALALVMLACGPHQPHPAPRTPGRPGSPVTHIHVRRALKTAQADQRDRRACGRLPAAPSTRHHRSPADAQPSM
jgi:hypothetical protein